MAHPMVLEVLDKYYPANRAKIRFSLKALCSENDLIDTMKLIPSHIDMSSLPQIKGDYRAVIISIASYDELEAKKYFELFVKFLEENNIEYFLTDK